MARLRELLVEDVLREEFLYAHCWFVNELMQPVVILRLDFSFVAQLFVHLSLLRLEGEVVDEAVKRRLVFLLLGEIQGFHYVDISAIVLLLLDVDIDLLVQVDVLSGEFEECFVLGPHIIAQ